MACRLVALNKCPGVRPIGIGETLRRIFGKAVSLVTKYDIEDVCGISQLCAGVRSGIEGAVHAINDSFNNHSEDGWGVLMVDASNAFNSINRLAILWNARTLWPRCSRFLFNTYRGWAPLIMKGTSTILYSREGVTQGDPLSMLAYAIGTLPLIRSLKHPQDGIQIWYADDASACAPLAALKDWIDKLIKEGPSYGYFPEPMKSFLVVSDSYLSKAHEVFEKFGVQVVTSHRLLGGVVGVEEGKTDFVKGMMNDWIHLIDRLTSVASDQPQAAYAAFTRSVQNKWLYLQRLVPNCAPLFKELESRIAHDFLPAVFGCEVSSDERSLFSLPTRYGGLNILCPVETAQSLFTLSRTTTAVLIKSLKGINEFDYGKYNDTFFTAQKEMAVQKEKYLEERFSAIIENLDQAQGRAVMRAKDEKISLWLNVLPMARHHFDLTPQEFRDALAIRYKKPLLHIPPNCDGCGSVFDLAHALSCRKGGLVIQRHNEIRDAFGDLSALAWSMVRREPIVREADIETNTPALIADLAVRGVWSPQTEALFDVRIVDTDARSYGDLSPTVVLGNAEKEKKDKYKHACEERRAVFTPLCISVDGLMGKEASIFLKRLAERLSHKWERSYSEIICWLRTHVFCHHESYDFMFKRLKD